METTEKSGSGTGYAKLIEQRRSAQGTGRYVVCSRLFCMYVSVFRFSTWYLLLLGFSKQAQMDNTTSTDRHATASRVVVLLFLCRLASYAFSCVLFAVSLSFVCCLLFFRFNIA